MTTNEQNDLAMAKDPTITSRIVKNMAQIEQDYRLADGLLSEWLMRMIILSMKGAAPEPFVVENTAWSAYLSQGLCKGRWGKPIEFSMCHSTRYFIVTVWTFVWKFHSNQKNGRNRAKPTFFPFFSRHLRSIARFAKDPTRKP